MCAPYARLGLRVRLRDGTAAGLRERDGVSVVHAGQPKRPQFTRRYLVGYGVKVDDVVPVPLRVAVIEDVRVRVAVSDADALRVPVRVPVSDALGERVWLRVPLPLRVRVTLGVALRVVVARGDGVGVAGGVLVRLLVPVALDDGVHVLLTVVVDECDGVGMERNVERHVRATPPVEKDAGTVV